MENLTVVMTLKRVVIRISEDQLSKAGHEALKKEANNFINSVFVISNGSFYEIFDDSEDDEVEATKTIASIDLVELDQIIVTIESEYSFSVPDKLTTKQLLEWQEENDPFAFGVSLSINPEFLKNEDDAEAYELEVFDDFSIAVVD
jgi:hypothetical protein